MERHSLRALVSIGVLIILAWVGIALVAKARTSGGMMAATVVWAVVVVAVLSFGIWSLARARQAWLNRKPETLKVKS